MHIDGREGLGGGGGSAVRDKGKTGHALGILFKIS